MMRTTLDILSLVSTLVRAVSRHYGDRLVSLAVFGSIARRAHTPESDVDIFIISDDLPDGRLVRVREFAFPEEIIEREMGWELMLSSVLKTPNEALHGSPLRGNAWYWILKEEYTPRRGFRDMTNIDLAASYPLKAQKRLRVLDILLSEEMPRVTGSASLNRDQKARYPSTAFPRVGTC